jgi:hypothetical protein
MNPLDTDIAVTLSVGCGLILFPVILCSMFAYFMKRRKCDNIEQVLVGEGILAVFTAGPVAGGVACIAYAIALLAAK